MVTLYGDNIGVMPVQVDTQVYTTYHSRHVRIFTNIDQHSHLDHH